ncbi:MAG: hypothetical protein WAR40_04765 [Desulfomonilia bacterium]
MKIIVGLFGLMFLAGLISGRYELALPLLALGLAIGIIEWWESQ